MKTTGIVRRIDDLGRIVIPKEIRKNLKLNEGDSLEIYLESNNILLKKYSIFDNNKLYEELITSFYKIYRKKLLITDREKVIAISNDIESIYLNSDLTSVVRDLIVDRKDRIIDNNRIIINGDVVNSFYIYPIIIDSDVIGSIILIDGKIDDNLISAIKLLNIILVKNIE